MNHLFGIVQAVDLRIFQFLCRFAGNRILDRIVDFEESSQLSKGGLIFSAYWWVWFRRGPDREKSRRSIIAIGCATVLAIVVTRILAAVAPFRIRPMYVPNIHHHWSIPINVSFAQWNSFPSDTATFFWALVFGLMVLLPRLRIPLVLYTTVWICFPRVYFGYHYASDVVAGAAIGVGVVWIVIRAEGWQSAIVPRILAFADSRPDVFYAVAFLSTFEMAVVFWDVRMLERKLVHAVQMLENHGTSMPSTATPMDSLVVFAGLLLALVAAIVVLLTRQSEHGHKQITSKSR